MTWPVGTKVDMPIEVIARDLKGHRFYVKLAGLKPGEYSEQLVEVTGDYDDLNAPRALEVKVVSTDAPSNRR
jgi:hypothetical protein